MQVTAMTRMAKTIILVAIPFVAACSTPHATPLQDLQSRIRDLNMRALATAEDGYKVNAQKLLQEALQLASSIDDKDGQIVTLLNQSRLARHAANPQQAESLLKQVLPLAAGTSHYADVAQEKAIQELEADHLDEALYWAQRAREAEQGNLIGRRLNLLARIALKRNRKDEAARFAEQALEANKDSGLELEQANSLRMLGIIKTQSGQVDKAEELLQQALLLDKEQAASSKIAADLEALAELAASQKDPALQQEYLQRARVVRGNSKCRKNN